MECHVVLTTRVQPYIQWCLQQDIEPLQNAGLLPTPGHIEEFSESLNEIHEGHNPDLHTVLHRFDDIAAIRSGYFLCRRSEMYEVAKKLSDLNLPLRDKYTRTLVLVPGRSQYMSHP